MALTLDSHGPQKTPLPKEGFLRKLAPAILVAGMEAACTDISDRIHDTMDTGQDTAIPECPDRGQNVYTWQLHGFYDYPDSLRELAATTGMNNGIITTSPEYIEYMLDNFAEAGLRFTPQLAQWSDYTTADGYFDFNAWEQKIRAYEGMDLQAYIDSGTFAGVVILDDLGNFTDEGPDSATLDQMAALIKEVFNISDENFPIIVRHDATDMLPKHNGHNFQHLNRVYIQITDIKAQSDVPAYIQNQIAAANKLGLEIIWGVNLLDWEWPNQDGICPSGHIGYQTDRCGIPADEIVDVAAGIRASCNSGVGSWKLSDDFPYAYEEEDYQEALKRLAERAN